MFGITLTGTLALMTRYGYAIIFPIVVIEGPMITVLSGLLISLGVLNPILTYIIVVVGDVTGDLLYYWFGRVGSRTGWAKKYLRFFGYTEKSQEFLESHFRKHKGKTFVLGKLANGVGGAVLVAAGVAGVPISEFVWWNFICTVPKSLILLLIGYYIGNSYLQIGHYFDVVGYVTVGIAVLFILIYFIGTRYANKYFSKE